MDTVIAVDNKMALDDLRPRSTKKPIRRRIFSAEVLPQHRKLCLNSHKKTSDPEQQSCDTPSEPIPGPPSSPAVDHDSNIMKTPSSAGKEKGNRSALKQFKRQMSVVSMQDSKGLMLVGKNIGANSER